MVGTEYRASSSALMETVAAARGLTTHRLGRDVVVCDADGGPLAFVGFAGALSNTVAQALCHDDARVRQHLVGRGVPVVEPGSDGGGTAEYAVVDGAVVRTDAAAPTPEVEQLAVDAVAALPGCAYGSVTVADGPDGPGVVTVDPRLRRWHSAVEAATVAAAILDVELRRR